MYFFFQGVTLYINNNILQNYKCILQLSVRFWLSVIMLYHSLKQLSVPHDFVNVFVYFCLQARSRFLSQYKH